MIRQMMKALIVGYFFLWLFIFFKVILIALAGNDPETRSELAFRTLMVKLQYSDSLKYWNYIIKNLIILDRCVEEKYFLYDLRELNFPHIENYKEEDSKFSIF